MDFKTHELTNKLFELFDSKLYQEAVEVANKIEQINPEMKYKTYFWRTCLYSVQDREVLAINELQQGLEEGIWWNPDTLLNDPDLKPLQALNEFQNILKQCENKLGESKRQTKPEYTLLSPKNENVHLQTLPLVYSLHWRGDNIERFSQYWNIASVRENTLLAFPQSSQVYGYNQYCWDDHELAKSEVMATLEQIKNEKGMQSNDVIFAGASQGGKLAFELALRNSVMNIRGFILVVPSFKDITEYTSLIAKNKGMKGFIVTGDKDYFYSTTLDLHKELVNRNFPCELYVIEGMGHFFPNDFSDILPQAINYVLK